MIDINSSNLLTRCNEVFELQKNQLREASSSNTLISYFGYFSQDLINSLCDNVEETLISIGEKKTIIKRIFSISIEGMQNIRVHGTQEQEIKNYGAFILAKNETTYFLIIGNIIPKSSVSILEERIENLNKLDQTNLKNHYIDVLTNGNYSDKGNAGLGLITMRMKSEQKIEPTFIAIDEDFYLFSLNLKLIV